MTEYITQYEYTIVFNPRSIFEMSVAYLANRSQPIPMLVDNYQNELLDKLETCALSPKLILFNNSLDQIKLDQLLKRGYSSVYIFDKSADCIVNKHNRLFYFNYKNIFDIIFLFSHSARLLVEYILCAISDHQSVLSDLLDVNAANGKILIDVMIADSIYYDKIFELCNHVRSCENIRDLINKGVIINNYKSQLLQQRVDNGFTYLWSNNIISAIYSEDIYNDVTDLIKSVSENQSTPTYQFILLYKFNTMIVEEIKYPIWNIVLISTGDQNAFSSLELMSGKTCPGGNSRCAEIWVSTTTAKNILPFIYP